MVPCLFPNFRAMPLIGSEALKHVSGAHVFFQKRAMLRAHGYNRRCILSATARSWDVDAAAVAQPQAGPNFKEQIPSSIRTAA